MPNASRPMRMNDTVLREARDAVLCWLASVDSHGVPNVTPKELFAPRGDSQLVVADVASTNTVNNIRQNSQVCLSFVDVFRQKGFKIVGAASLLAPDDPSFSEIGGEVLEMAGPDFRVRHLILVDVHRIERIWAPSFSIFPDRTKEERLAPVYSRYGVQPVPAT